MSLKLMPIRKLNILGLVPRVWLGPKGLACRKKAPTFIYNYVRFCTVLEFVSGNDLDFLLKQNKTIPEKEVQFAS